MGYKIKYTGPDAGRKALIDMIQYVGHKKYKLLVRFASNRKQKFRAVRFVCGFAGVEGFPVNEFIKRYHPRMK